MQRIILLIAICIYFTNVTAQQTATVITYPLPGIYNESGLFSLRVCGKNIPVVSYTDKYDYVHFSVTEGLAEIVITVLGKTQIKICSISPLKENIQAALKNNTATFAIKKHGYFIIKIDSLKELVIAADEEEKDKPSSYGQGVFNISEPPYNVKTNNSATVTTAVQKAIDDAAVYVGNSAIVYIPAGVYPIGNLILKSNVSLYLEGGAVLLFTGKRKDYAVNAYKKSQKRDITWWLSTPSGTQHCKIYGRGTLDGNGKYSTEQNNLGNNILLFMNNSDVIVDGIIIKNSGAWAVLPVRSDNVILKNLKLFNRFDMGENDGIDVIESQNVIVEHAIGIALDDPFSAKTWTATTDIAVNWPGKPEPQNNILFKDLISWTYCYGYKIGQGIAQPQTNIQFKNCVVYDAAVGIGIHHKWGTSFVSDVIFDDIDIEQLHYQNDDHRTWCVLLVQKKEYSPTSTINNISIKNVLIRDAGISPGKIKGAVTGGINNVKFENIKMPGKTYPALTLQEMHITDTVNCKAITVLQSPGF